MRDECDLQDRAPEGANTESSTLALAGALTPALALAACGGGGGGSDSGGGTIVGPGPTPTPAPVALTPQQASRFLGQASMGATRESIDRVIAVGFDGWLTEQFGTARATRHYDWMAGAGFADPANINNTNGYEPSVWRQLIAGRDQLRQRVGMALLEILVVGMDGLQGNWRQFAAAAYFDILLDNAFGNYRTLIEQVSLSPAMGQYLTFLGNRKANPNTGSVPDENYAREIMQLFMLGVSRLNPDGTVQNGAPETYAQADVSGLARVFTGFVYAAGDAALPERLRQPLAVNASQHETGAKTFLGATIPAGTDAIASLRSALDTLFAHPNVPPFVSRQLIQRLVTSNPSPGYVSRVAGVFANNGQGVRGDLRATVRAILLDAEAREDTGLSNANFGKLREPIMRLTAWARAFGVNSPSEAWGFGDTSNPTNRLAQSTGRSPSVFNFFRPGYTPPNTAIANAGLVAPELQIANEISVVGYMNYMQGLIANGAGDTKADYTAILTKASDAAALVDEVNLLLAAGQLSAATVATIRQAVESVATTASNAAQNRVNIAIMLTMAAPEFLVQK